MGLFDFFKHRRERESAIVSKLSNGSGGGGGGE
jgi:hypothetical protein